MLVVCNTKRQAQFLYEQLRQDDIVSFHLSAAMCQAHRKAVIAQMDAALDEGRRGGPKVLCVSTQVIEAGVDISFGAVIRLTAGMDNAVQTAGRCNRNGESAEPASAYLLTCSDENLSLLWEIQNAKTAALQLLSAFRRSPEQFGGDLASDAAIACYYRNLYHGMGGRAQDDPLKDRKTLFDLLSVNEAYAVGWPGMEQFGLHQAFKEAGHAFQVFDQDTTDVLGPLRGGRRDHRGAGFLRRPVGLGAAKRTVGSGKTLRRLPLSVSTGSVGTASRPETLSGRRCSGIESRILQQRDRPDFRAGWF